MNRFGLAFAAFLVSFLAVLIARFPLALTLDLLNAEAKGLSAPAVTGTIWSGRLDGAALGSLPIGNLELKLDPRSLLGGKARLTIALERTGLLATGRFTAEGGGVYALEESQLEVRLIELPTLVPLSGSFTLDIERIEMGPEGCRVARADLWTDALLRSRASLDWQGPVLEGTAECRGGILTLPLAGGDETGRVRIEMRLMPGFQYRIVIRITPEDAGLRRRLPLLGFVSEGNGGYRLIQKGQLKTPREAE